MRNERRQFLKGAVAAAAAVAGLGADAPRAQSSGVTPMPTRKFTVCLSCGPVGVPDDPAKAIERAKQFGFESIEPSPSFLAKLSDAELNDYLGRMRAANLAWGAAGLPVEFKGD